MACQCAPALIVLRDEINRAFLRRDKSSDGCCGDAAHAARKSDHNPVGGYAHALDIDEDIEPGRDLLWLKPILLRDVRTKYVIYEARIAYPDGTDKPYTGPNAHRHHLHLSIKPNATHIKTPWLGNATPPPPEEAPFMGLTDAEQVELLLKVRDLHAAVLNEEDPNDLADEADVLDSRNKLAKLVRAGFEKLGVTGI